MVPAGEGLLWWEPGPDDGGDVVDRTPAGWRVTHRDATVCADTRRAAVAAAHARRDARSQAAADQQRQIDALLAQVPDCICSGYSWSTGGVLDPEIDRPVSFVAIEVPDDSALAGMSPGHSNWRERRTIDGQVCYTHAFGNACVLYAPRTVVEAAWAAHLEFWDQQGKLEAVGLTPGLAAEWLDEYGPEGRLVLQARTRLDRGESVSPLSLKPCAGWECKAFAAGRRDLLP
jgi:hypothetical protein